MLNTSGKGGHPDLVPDLAGKHSVFTMNYVSFLCVCFSDALDQDEKFPFYSEFVECFYNERVLEFCQVTFLFQLR